MNRFWISWWAARADGSFELHSPWWFSGYRTESESSVCAAVIADSEEAAKEVILAAYDTRPSGLEFRFVEQKPDDWSPFNTRFRQRDWMQWP